MTASSQPGIEQVTDPYAVRAIREYLKDFSPVDRDATDFENFTLTFRIVNWVFAPNVPAPNPTSEMGSLIIQRRVRNGEIEYQIEQQTEVGGTNHLEAQILCEDNELDTLKSWNIKTRYMLPSGKEDERLVLAESGTNREGTIRLGSGQSFQAENPVVSQWTVLHHLMTRGNEHTHSSFELLQDLSLFKPNQTLMYDGPLRIDNKDGLNVGTFVQIGSGIQPIHYLLDDQMRPQIVTFSILAWILKDIT